ncbi:MAG: amidohydrolase [Acidobacteriaceae bacterium]
MKTLQIVAAPCLALSSCLAFFGAVSSFAAAQPAPDVIYYHGSILTGVGLESATPQRVSAIAVSQGKVESIGSDADILKLKGPKTQLVDLHGAFAMPGFNDAHVHFAGAGEQKLHVDLTGCKSLAEMQARIKAAAAKAAPGTWLQGGGWDHTLWASKQLPTRVDLDAVTAGHPAIFERIDGHIAVVNSAGFVAAGISSQTQDPQGGKFDRDSDGNLTGIVREGPAMTMIYNKVPPPDLPTRVKALQLSIQDALANGITSVQDYSEWPDFLAFEYLEKMGKLPLRVSEWLTFNNPLTILKSRRAEHPANDPLLHTGMLKGFMDGSLGSHTAALEAPYADEPNNYGIPRYDQQKLNQMAAERALAGFQMGFHAIGDRAVDMALNAYQAAEQVLPEDTNPADLRYRIEHAQVVLPADIRRFAQLGVIASIQPCYILTDMNWAEQRLGKDRLKDAYPLKTFFDHGIPVAFSTDYPVEPITPFRGLYAAVTRMNTAGTMSFRPEEKITLGQALYAYTQGSAYAEKEETIKGKLVPGYLADMTVLDRDLTRIPSAEILKTQVLRTVVGGKTVFEK